MEEFKTSSVAWKWKFRLLELGMEEFEPNSMLGIGNGGVRDQFRRWESGMEEFEQSSRFGIANEQVRVIFRFLESGMEVWVLESGM